MGYERITEFFEKYDTLKAKYPGLYLQMKEYSKEPSTWRIQIIGRGMSPRGDAELLYAEAESREAALMDALEKIKDIENNISKLKEMKADYVRRILANHIN